jgi:hypothetical protein
MLSPLYGQLSPLRVPTVVKVPLPKTIPGLQLWLDATTGLYDATSGGNTVTTDGASIARWEDQSGNGYHVRQTTANNQPVLKTNQQNGLNIVRFDGSNDFLSSANNFSVTGGSNRTVFIVFNRDTSQNKSIVSWGVNSAGQAVLFTQEFFLRFNSTIKGYTNQGANGAWSLWATVGAGSTLGDYHAYFNGGGITTPTSTTNNSNALNTGSSPIYIAKTSYGADYADGDMAEVLIYNSALSNADREAVRDYLNAKWAVY